MLDIKRIRENTEEVKAALKRRGTDYSDKIDEILATDEARRTLASKIDGLKEEFARLREEVRVDRAKTNTRLNVLIAILSTLAVPIVGVCVKLLFG